MTTPAAATAGDATAGDATAERILANVASPATDGRLRPRPPRSTGCWAASG